MYHIEYIMYIYIHILVIFVHMHLCYMHIYIYIYLIISYLFIFYLSSFYDIYTIIHTSLVSIFTYPCIHLCIYTYVHICVTVQYYSLYRTDPCGCPPHEPTSLPQDFRVPLACHWLWRPSPPQAPEAVETVDAEQDSQGNSNSGEVATR